VGQLYPENEGTQQHCRTAHNTRMRAHNNTAEQPTTPE